MAASLFEWIDWVGEEAGIPGERAGRKKGLEGPRKRANMTSSKEIH